MEHVAVEPQVHGSRAIASEPIFGSHCIKPRSLRAALHNSEALNRSILEASADCIKIVSRDGMIELMNAPGLCAMELASLDHVVGREWSSLWPADIQEAVRAAVTQASAGAIARFTGFCPTAKGSPRWWDVVVTPMQGEDGTIIRLLVISRDVTATRAAVDELRWASEHDALTELPNRRAFEAHLQAATIRAMEGGGGIGLLLIDLDHFKHVNDTLGHGAGDLLLKTFGRRLKQTVRAQDYVARLGGDEFAVVLHNVASEADLMVAGESILSRLHDPVVFEGRVVGSGASIGGAMFPRDAACANDLLKNADTALYALKASGRGGTKLFHSYMREQLQVAAAQLSLARRAVAARSLVPVYQPKIELGSGKIVGFEALMRWRHPERGLQLPDTLAEAFKDYEHASAIGEQMQQAVLQDVARWSGSSLAFGRVSINAAPAEFLRDDFAERLMNRLQRHSVLPELIEIEVTEHVFLDRGAEYVSRALRMLHEAGVRVALDDFGTGYSSLSHLRDFPVEVLKIDRSFVSKVSTDSQIAAIVSAVIDLATRLSIDVVAEGIEEPDQADFLRRSGCGFAQGYFFGCPALADEVPHLLDGGHLRDSAYQLACERSGDEPRAA
jgi:diguanylate cyclase (GGDEF)-like protein/PAS domain S-box-containing protein